MNWVRKTSRFSLGVGLVFNGVMALRNQYVLSFNDIFALIAFCFAWLFLTEIVGD